MKVGFVTQTDNWDVLMPIMQYNVLSVNSHQGEGMKRKAKKKAELIAVTFKLTREDHQKLAALAERRGISMAGQLRMWIRGES